MRVPTLEEFAPKHCLAGLFTRGAEVDADGDWSAVSEDGVYELTMQKVKSEALFRIRRLDTGFTVAMSFVPCVPA